MRSTSAREHLCTKVTPSLDLTYCKNRENLGFSFLEFYNCTEFSLCSELNKNESLLELKEGSCFLRSCPEENKNENFVNDNESNALFVPSAYFYVYMCKC